MTQLEVLQAFTPELNQLNRQAGSKEMGINVLDMMVVQLAKWFGSDMVPGETTREVAEMIHRQYHWLTLAEIKHFIAKAKAGEYDKKETRYHKGKDGADNVSDEWDGKVYGKLSPAVLMRWVEAYAAESMVARRDMQYTDQRAAQVAGLLPAGNVEYVSADRIREAFEPLAKKLTGWKAEEDAEAAAHQQERREAMIRADRARWENPKAWEQARGNDYKPTGEAPAPESEPERTQGDFYLVRKLAERMAAGEQPTEEDRQLQANYPHRLEEELKDLQTAA